ncbi:MAG: translocation/assembly module TamB domain-containing protein [Mangrovibacterium sp.]|nr:translocation/assembly module TamB domain-containing protein [Mangrovibacterium sp.]
MKKTARYILLISGGLLVFLLIVVILAVLILQTGAAKNKLARLVEQQASRYLDGDLSIGEIDGNFYDHLLLDRLSLVSGDDTIASVSRLDLHYNLWPLIRGRLHIRETQLIRPRLHLKQINDSAWNVQQIMKPLPDSEGREDQEPAGNFSVNLAAFRLTDGTVFINSPDTLIPRQVNQLNTSFSLHWSNEKQQIVMDRFSLSTRQPDLRLEQLAFRLKRDTSRIELAGLTIRTAMNQIVGKAALTTKKSEKSAALLQSDPLFINEFGFFLPELTFPATPALQFDASIRNDSLHAVLDISDKDQDIRLELVSPNFGILFDHQANPVLHYALQADLKRVDLAHWLGKPDLRSLINGRIHTAGSGTDWKTATISLDGHFADSRIADYPVNKLEMKFILDQRNLEGFATADGNFGTFTITPRIRDLGGTPAYTVDLLARGLNLAHLTGVDSLQSEINLQARIDGKGFDPKSLAANASVNVGKFWLRTVHIDTLFAGIRYARERIQLDPLSLKTGDLQFAASGDYGLQSASDILFAATFTGIGEFAPFLPVDSLQTSGSLNGHLTGVQDSLNIHVSASLNESGYQDFSLQGLRLESHLLLTPADTLVRANLHLKNPGNKSLTIDSLSAWIDGRPDSIYVDALFNHQDLKTRLKTVIQPGHTLKLTVTDWLIDYQNEHWALRKTPATIEIDTVNYRINQLIIASGTADSSQYMKAHGVISRLGEEDFEFCLGNIDLARMAALFQSGMDVSGLLTLNLDLKGTAASPSLKGGFNFQKAVFNKYPLHRLGGSFNYRDNQAGMAVQVVPRDSGSVDLSGTVPLQMRLDSMTFRVDPQSPLDARLSIREFPMAILHSLVTADAIKGHVNGNLNIGGTVHAPSPEGSMNMRNGSIKMDQYGVDYRDIGFYLRFLPEKIALDTFLIKTSDGRVTATGQSDFNSVFYKGDLDQSKITFHFNKFNPFNHRDFNMQLSGVTSLGSENGKMVFGGDLHIPRSTIFLPTILNMLGKMTAPEIPESILAREMGKMSGQTGTAVEVRQPENPKESTGKRPLENLTGKIRVRIPRNTWIKSDEMHIELSGDLEVLKNKDFFELFGTVDVVRGQYDLLGKTFVINKGTVRFQGGEEIAPHLDITASYRFRSPERVEQTLSVQVGGTAESPSVIFSMEGDPISEGDAFSYILFGKAMNALTAGQQSDVDGPGSGTLAGKAAASLISSQIAGFLGDKLNMDYLEIKSEGSFENATVVVGKYITNDLFVSYGQQFGGKSHRDDLVTWEVKLEYELFKFLFLQLNNSSVDSGFDLIFKFNANVNTEKSK